MILVYLLIYKVCRDASHWIDTEGAPIKAGSAVEISFLLDVIYQFSIARCYTYAIVET